VKHHAIDALDQERVARLQLLLATLGEREGKVEQLILVVTGGAASCGVNLRNETSSWLPPGNRTDEKGGKKRLHI
jgi:hypothetical protein